MDIEDTIVATATSHDNGGLRGIVRISGWQTATVIDGLFEGHTAADLKKVVFAERISGSIAVREPIGRVPCELYWWPTKRSYTRQPTAELHTFGAIPLLDAIVETCCQSGARLARPGEFTLRAFLAGRIDLAQAEAVLGVIDAVDDRELNVALSQLSGGLSQPLDAIRNGLLNLCADLEAGLDFVDEDIDFISQEEVERELQTTARMLDQTLERMHSRDHTGQLPRVVLRGEPNTGKSSIWNRICRDANAIVTNQAGTTRDFLVGEVTADESKFSLIDTAGLEHGVEPLSRALRKTSDDQAESAELILLCIDSSRPLTRWERLELSRSVSHRLVVFTKCDLLQDTTLVDVVPDLRTSEKDADSMQTLVRRCAQELEVLGSESTVVASTAVRCRESLRQAREAVERAVQLSASKLGDELVVAEVRTALDYLGQIVGEIYADDILDRIFSRFCIGK